MKYLFSIFFAIPLSLAISQSNPNPADVIKKLYDKDEKVRKSMENFVVKKFKEMEELSLQDMSKIEPEELMPKLQKMEELGKYVEAIEKSVNEFAKKTEPKDIPISMGYLGRNSLVLNGLSKDILVKIGKSAIPALLEALENKNARLKAGAINVLGRIKADPEIVAPRLIELLKDKDESVANNAAITLTQMGHPVKTALPFLVRSLRDLELSYSARMALKSFGKEAVPELIKALNRENNFVRQGILRILKEMKVAAKIAALPHLLKMLDDRASGHSAAGVIATFGVLAVADLLKIFDAKSKVAKKNAIETLQNMPSKIAVPALIKILERKNTLDDRDYEWQLKKAFAKIGAPAIPALVKILKDKNWEKKIMATEVLRDMKFKKAKSVEKLVPVLIEMLSYTEERKAKRLMAVRENAAKVLVKIGEFAIAALVKALNDNKNATRLWASIALLRMGSKAESTIPHLVKALSDPYPTVYWNVARALRGMGKKSVPALIKELQSKNHTTKVRVVTLLGGMKAEAKAAVPALHTLLNDKKLEKFVSKALKQIKGS